ncbi:MAG: hypothetical protein S0880_00790 [Actinomycetota bacterium]|nr:hypothetical protein [Actinomycetota bacterium]
MNADVAAPADGPPGQLADYELDRLLERDQVSYRFLAPPPARLGVSDEWVEVIVTAESDDVTHDRLVEDLAAVAALRDPHVVTLHDIGRDAGWTFVSVEHSPSGTLARPARQPERSHWVRAVADAARGAHALHEIGLAHGAITPGAVVLSSDGGKLSAPSFAAGGHNSSSSTVAVVTGIGFVDPAAMRGEIPERSAEVFALGAVLHWAVSGRTVHPGVDTMEGPDAIRELLRREAQVDPSIDPDTAAVIARLVDPDVLQRVRTADEAAELIGTLT